MNPPQQHPRILRVDEEPTFRILMRLVLEHLGYKVFTAPHAEKAFDRMAAYDFDLVGTGIRIAGLNGLKMCRIIRREFRALPVIMVTNCHPSPEAVDASGANDLIDKSS